MGKGQTSVTHSIKAGFIALMFTVLLPGVAMSADPQPGDACSASGVFVWSSDPGRMLICNGSAYKQGMEVATTGRSLFQVNNDAGACNADKLGRLRYDGTIWEYCNGGAWTNLLTGASAIPAAPDRSIQFNNSSSFGGSANLVYTAGGNFGIGTSTPTTEFMIVGTHGSGSTLSTVGAGTRMFFYPRKSAFRAGRIDGTQWNDANIGQYSAAFGTDNIASGGQSTVFGTDNEVSGALGMAWGIANTVADEGSTAWGMSTTSMEILSTAWGFYSSATGVNATAWGGIMDAVPGGTASAEATTAWGLLTTASGMGSTASGFMTNAEGAFSTAIGQGSSTGSGAESSFAWGGNNTYPLPGGSATGIASMAGGQGSTASGEASVAMGNLANASGSYSFAMGDASTASGTSSVALNGYSTAIGNYSFAAGVGTNAEGFASFAFGGPQTSDPLAAYGDYSMALGRATQAWGYASFAQGYYSLADADHTIAMGVGTHASSFAEISLGRWPLSTLGTPNSWVATDTLFEIGNGADNSNRANALTLLKNGKLGLLTAIPSYDLSISGEAARTIGLERKVSGAGLGLTVRAGGAHPGSTSLAGGNLTLASGISTGTNTGDVVLQVSGATSGTTSDNTLTEIMRLRGDTKGVQIGNAVGGTPIASGVNSFAQGHDNSAAGSITASGAGSFAQGASVAAAPSNITSSGSGSFAQGYATATSAAGAIVASNFGSFSHGYVSNANITASGNGSTAWGLATTNPTNSITASGDGSTAFGGVGTTASGTFSTAFGQSARASGLVAIAFGREVLAGSGTAADGNGDNSVVVGLQSNSQTVDPKVTGDRSMVLFFDSGTNNTNSGYDFTASDKFAIIGGEFQIDNQSSTANKGCIRYNSSTTKLEYSHDCSGGSPTYAEFGAGGLWTDNTSYISRTGNVAVLGTHGSTTAMPDLGAGTRMAFIPRKSAFRAGYVSGTEWNDANVGQYSVAMGESTTATGYASTAMGSGSLASGYASLAIGNYAYAEGNFSTALGNSSATDPLAVGAVAWGGTNMDTGGIAIGVASMAGGIGAISTGIASIALGYATTADGWFSLATGSYTTAGGESSTAMGSGSTAAGDYSTALGASDAIGYGSTAMGIGTHAGSYGETSLGRFSLNTPGTAGSWVATDTLFEIGNGASSGSRANALTLLKNGKLGIATAAPGTKFMVTGTHGSDAANTTTGAGTRMFFDTRKSAFRAGEISGTEWDDGNIGQYSVAMGWNTIASGPGSIALGTDTIASTVGSIAFGANTTASGEYSAAGGLWSEASGNYALAFGDQSSATGYGSIALGQSSIAMGDSSVAIGPYAAVSGNSGIALGSNIVVGDGTEGPGSYSLGIGLGNVVYPNIITGQKSVGIFMGSEGYELTEDNKFAIIGGEFQIDDAGGSSNKGCIRYNSASSVLQLSNDCSTYTGVGSTPAGTPASASSTCTAGQTRYDANYVYVCVATNTWKRAALSTW